MTDTIYHSGDVSVYRLLSSVDPARCRSEVCPDHGPLYQCGNQAKYHRKVEGYDILLGFCGTHDPKRVRERRAKIEAEKELRRAKKCAEKAEARQAEEMKDRALDAIRHIANGHPNPTGLANAVLDSCGS